MDALQKNKSLFKFGGTISRVDFAVRVFLVYLIPMILFISSTIYSIQEFAGRSAINYFAILLVVASIPIVLSLCFRRMRDIRGTLENDKIWQILTFFAIIIPYVNLFALVCLLVYPSKES